MPEIYDCNHHPVRHMRARVNHIRMHYVIAGEGEPLLLIHGTPKTHFYWYKLIPLLTDRYTVIAPDLRGFGDTDKPPAEDGYDSMTNARDPVSYTHLGDRESGGCGHHGTCTCVLRTVRSVLE